MNKLEEQLKTFRRLMLIDEIFNNTPTNLDNFDEPETNTGINMDLLETEDEEEKES